MRTKLRITIAQLNYTPGDIAGNTTKILQTYRLCAAQGSDVVIFGELAICGSPVKDLSFDQSFQTQCMKAVENISKETEKHSTTLIVGGIWIQNNRIYNSSLLISAGKIHALIGKHSISSNEISNEHQIFTRALIPKTVEYNGLKLGMLVGSDIFMDPLPKILRKGGSELLICLNSEPYTQQSNVLMANQITKISKQTQAPLILINQVGGNDGVVYSGGSMVVSSSGTISARLHEWQEEIVTHEWIYASGQWECINGTCSKPHNETQNTYQAMMMSAADMVQKNKMNGVVINATKGDLNTLLTTAVCADAVGPQNTCVALYENRSNKDTIHNMSQLISKMNIKCKVINMDGVIDACLQAISTNTNNIANADLHKAIMRMQAIITTSLSDNSNSLLISSTDKTDNVLGYSTLYGDTCGNINLLGDIYKTNITKLIEWRITNIPTHSKLPQLIKINPSALQKITTNQQQPQIEKETQEGEPKKTTKEKLNIMRLLKSKSNKSNPLPSLPLPKPDAEMDQVLQDILENNTTANILRSSGYNQSTVNNAIAGIHKYAQTKQQFAPILHLTQSSITNNKPLSGNL